MTETQWWIIVGSATALAALAGYLLGMLRAQRRLVEVSEAKAAAVTALEQERQAAVNRQAAFEQTRAQLAETFNTLSHQSLRTNSEEFLRLAAENFKQLLVKSSDELERREKSIDHMLKPIREALNKTEQQIREVEKERKEAYGSLHKHLESMAQTQQVLQNETRNLVQALRRPEVRGRWGELTLRRLVELAGMVEHCDFFEQEQISGEQGVLRPDMVIRMPAGREIVVDIKTPLDAYLSAVESTDDAQRQHALTSHARNVRARVRELAQKSYWAQFKHAPDFVVLFIPGEQFLAAALEHDTNLLEDALRQKVILATPTSFIALLRAVAYGWRQEQLAHNAEKIREIGEELFDRLTLFAEHLDRLGRSLDSSVNHFNKAVGSFDSRVLPSARKFSELGISGKKEIEPLQQVERGARSVESTEPASSS
ncbi:MAG: recombinase RmuC [Gammaproteobacteria bacterium SG8_47]|nr:MAG: recombinase RmuC [Gammaproteobacteria bacterium SG8_47]